MEREKDHSAGPFEDLVEHLPDVVARFDRQLRHLYVNAAIEGITARPRGEFIGKTNEELGMPPDLVRMWKYLLSAAFQSGEPVETEFTFDTGNGARTFWSCLVPERNRAGEVVAVLTLARDVTDSHLYRRAQRDGDRLGRLQSVTSAFSVASTPADVAQVLMTHGCEAFGADAGLVMFLDATGANLELVKMIGYTDAVADRWQRVPMEAPMPLTDAVRAREAAFYETHEEVLTRYAHLADARHPVDHALAAVPLVVDDRALGAMGLVFRAPRSFSDEDRQFITTLARHCAQALERARLFEAEQRARREAEAANRMKDEFLAMMSHELRTPLNAISGWVNLLLEGGLPPEKERRGLETIERNAKAQTRIMDDLLDVSRIIAGKLRLELAPMDMPAVITMAIESSRPAADSKGVQLHTLVEPDAGVIEGDAARIQQVTWNLLSNAIKFTPKGGQVHVRLRRDGSNLEMTVEDTGLGIAPEFLPYVFDRFRQADHSTTRSQSGLGLGLAIVRQLVELHGGSIEAFSAGIGKGASFVVRLPIAH